MTIFLCKMRKQDENDELITSLNVNINSLSHLLSLKYGRTDKGSHDNQTEQSDCNKQLIASFFKMTKMLFCPVEDENKNYIKWCYPPSFAKNLTLCYEALPS